MRLIEIPPTGAQTQAALLVASAKWHRACGRKEIAARAEKQAYALAPELFAEVA